MVLLNISCLFRLDSELNGLNSDQEGQKLGAVPIGWSDRSSMWIHQEWIQKRRNGSRDEEWLIDVAWINNLGLLFPTIPQPLDCGSRSCCFVGPLQMQDWPTGISQAKHSKTILPWFIDKNDEEPIETRALFWFQWEMYVSGTRESELTN